jgi:hypothetical protein
MLASPSPRIAVCVAGQLRSAACVAADSGKHGTLTPVGSIRSRLLEPLREHASVDVFTAFDTPPRGAEQRLPGALVSTLQQVLSVLQPVQGALIDAADDESAYEQAQRAIDKYQLKSIPNATACAALAIKISTLYTAVRVLAAPASARDARTRRVVAWCAAPA